MSLRTRIFLFTAALVTVLLSVVFLLVHQRVRYTALADASKNLEVSIAAMLGQVEDHRQQRMSQASLLTRLPEISIPLDQNEIPSQEVLDQVLELYGAGADLLILFGREGQILAGAGFADATTLPQVVDAQPVAAALRGTTTAGAWSLNERLYSVIATPIRGLAAQDIAGVLLLGNRVTGSASPEALADNQIQMVVVVDGDVMGETQPPELAEAVVAALPGLRVGEPKRLNLAATPYLVQLDTVQMDLGGEVCSHVMLRSLTSVGRLSQGIWRDTLMIAASALLLTLFAAWLGSKELTQPLRSSAKAMMEMARTGQLDSAKLDAGSIPEIRLFQGAFDQLIESIEQTETERELTYMEAVGAVVVAIDARDHETTGHSFRVTRYAMALGATLGLEEGALKTLKWGSLLHDIGKIAVPDAVLLKPGPLTEEEWHIMRQHATWGAEMLAGVGFLRPAIEIVANHQERYDGTGYPTGLKGEEIPLGARIFAVVDTYDSITSDRPYRSSRSHAEAIAELQRVAGSQLDPAMVEAFLSIPEHELRRLRALSSRGDLVLDMPRKLSPADGVA